MDRCPPQDDTVGETESLIIMTHTENDAGVNGQGSLWLQMISHLTTQALVDDLRRPITPHI